MLDTLKLIVSNSDCRLRFLIFNANPVSGDLKITEQFIQNLPAERCEVIPYDPDPSKMWYAIQECDTVLAVRLHAAVFACMTQVPFFLVEYHKKCSDWLDDIEYPAQFRIGDMQTDPKHLSEMLLESISSNQPKFAVDKMSDRAMLNFKGVSLF